MTIAITIGGVSEQDLDLFFLEEVIANDAFRTWLLSKVPGWPTDSNELVSAARSVGHANGELDLVFTFQDPSGTLARLLTENKISAGFQPDQLIRYREHASHLTQGGEFAHVAVALLAPAAYAGSSGKVDAMISYEDVEGWLSAQAPDARNAYKLRLIRTAIERRGSGYNPDSDQAITDFWQAYWCEAVRLAPELEMMQPGGKPSGSAFVWFACADLPGDLNICHKLVKGFVDLHFPALGGQVSQLRAALGPIIAPGMEITKASKSAAVRIVVPRLKTGLPFPEQERDVHSGIEAAKALREWARRNSARLIEIRESLAKPGP